MAIQKLSSESQCLYALTKRIYLISDEGCQLVTSGLLCAVGRILSVIFWKDLKGFWGTLNPETGVKTVQIWCLRWVFFITTFKSFIFADTRTPLQSTVFCKSWTQRKGHCFILGFGNVTNSLILMIFNSVRFKNRTSTSLRLVSSCKMQWFQ